MTRDDTTRRSRRAAVMVALAAATALTLAGCGSDGQTTSPSDTAAGTAQTSAQTSAPAAAPDTSAPVASTPPATKPNALTVTALDSAKTMSFTVSGSPHAGLVTITLDNKGKYAHELGIFRMKPDATLAQLEQALMSNSKDSEAKAKALLIDPDKQIDSPAIIGPGLAEQVTVPLAAGHYAITCFLPGPDGMPHAAMGMIEEFTVGAGTADSAPPEVKGEIGLRDDAIVVPAGFGTGGVYKVTNTGTRPHDFGVAKLAGAQLPAFFQCVGASFGKGTPIDKCPGVLQGGISFLAPGASAYLLLQLAPGTYNYVSTQGDGADMQAGLAGTFRVS